MRSDEIMNLDESMGTIENDLGHYDVYMVSPQLREGLGLALVESGSMVSLVKESLVTRFRLQE
jgi:hypothetical protein